MASGSNKDGVIVWDTTRWKIDTILPGEKAIFSPNGETIAATMRNYIVLWSARGSALIPTLGSSQMLLLYILHRLYIPGWTTVLSEIEETIKTKYGKGLPEMLNLQDSFDLLPDNLRELVRDCYQVKAGSPSSAFSRQTI